jgi:hypothetical protein
MLARACKLSGDGDEIPPPFLRDALVHAMNALVADLAAAAQPLLQLLRLRAAYSSRNVLP